MDRTLRSINRNRPENKFVVLATGLIAWTTYCSFAAALRYEHKIAWGVIVNNNPNHRTPEKITALTRA